jgi:hypothetical protein
MILNSRWMAWTWHSKDGRWKIPTKLWKETRTNGTWRGIDAYMGDNVKGDKETEKTVDWTRLVQGRDKTGSCDPVMGPDGLL